MRTPALGFLCAVPLAPPLLSFCYHDLSVGSWRYLQGSPFRSNRHPPLGGPTEARKLSGVFILARTFDRTPSFFTRCDRFLVKVDVLQLTNVNIGANLCPGGNHRSWQFADPGGSCQSVRLSGQSCVVNRGRPILWMFVDEVGYPHLVDRHLNRLVVSFAV